MRAKNRAAGTNGHTPTNDTLEQAWKTLRAAYGPGPFLFAYGIRFEKDAINLTKLPDHSARMDGCMFFGYGIRGDGYAMGVPIDPPSEAVAS